MIVTDIDNTNFKLGRLIPLPRDYHMSIIHCIPDDWSGTQLGFITCTPHPTQK